MHLHWAGKSSIGIFLVNFQKSSEQPYDGKLSTAHESGCFQLYVSHITVTSATCSTKVYIYIYILSFFSIQRSYGTLKQNLVKFLTTLKSLTKMLNHLDHIIWQINCANLWLFSREIQDVAVPKETWKFSERSLSFFADLKFWISTF